MKVVSSRDGICVRIPKSSFSNGAVFVAGESFERKMSACYDAGRRRGYEIKTEESDR
jgi:hypothetical protein